MFFLWHFLSWFFFFSFLIINCRRVDIMIKDRCIIIFNVLLLLLLTWRYLLLHHNLLFVLVLFNLHALLKRKLILIFDILGRELTRRLIEVIEMTEVLPGFIQKIGKGFSIRMLMTLYSLSSFFIPSFVLLTVSWCFIIISSLNILAIFQISIIFGVYLVLEEIHVFLDFGFWSYFYFFKLKCYIYNFINLYTFTWLNFVQNHKYIFWSKLNEWSFENEKKKI